MAETSIQITLSELQELLCRIGDRLLEPDDWPVVEVLVAKRIAQAMRRQEKMAAKAAHEAERDESEGPARMIDAEYIVDDADDSCASGTKGPADDEVGPRNESGSASRITHETVPAKPQAKRRGHGRNGAEAYVNAKHSFHKLPEGVFGAICSACGLGRMHPYREKLIVQIKGQPLFDATTHHFEQARCRLCGAVIRAQCDASVVDGVGSNYITYDWSACAMLLVMHYFAGLPFKRIELLQAGWGIPMADANQWRLSDVSADRLFPLYKAIERFGIMNAFALRIDDTGSMIITVRAAIRAEIAALEKLGESTSDVRTGINATGVYLETHQGKILLFFTGRHHASEIIDQLLQFRSVPDNSAKLVKVSDAASKNFSHEHANDLDEAICNAHAFLKFRAIKDQDAEVYALAGAVYKAVFDNDDVAKARGMDPQQRMLYHRAHSLPEMKKLKKMCCDKLRDRLVEPNSALWEPITFIVNQWERLIKFCQAPGIPLDTNVVEQMLIIPVRYLAGSFNYKTQNGADVGDQHMSLIATANANGVEPVAYLTECLRNHEDLAKRPEYYLPWVYRERIKAADREKATSAASVMHPLRPGTHRPQPAAGIDLS